MDSNNRTVTTKKKKKRRKKRYLLRFLIFVAVCVGIYFTLHISYFNINGIAVAGNSELSDEEIISLSKIETGENLFDVHPFLAERKIKKNLYVEDVKVKRVLPNKIRIEVTERSGAAQFVKGKGKKLRYVIIDSEGMVLEISKEQRNVTMVEGVDVKEAEKKKTIEVKQTSIYTKAMNIIQTADENDMYFKKIVITDGTVNAYIYDELICKGKYDNFMECLENGTIRSVAFDLYQKGTEKGTINIGSNNYCSFTSSN